MVLLEQAVLRVLLESMVFNKYILIVILCFTTYISGSSEIIEHAERYLHVREITHNRGVEIDSMNVLCNVPLGSPWCASFASWIYYHADYDAPISAWSPSYAMKKDIIYKKNLKNNKKIQAGDAVTFYYSNLKRVGHVGIIVKQEGDYLYTIEGNTNENGSREGDGVYRKKRDINKIYAVTRYYEK